MSLNPQVCTTDALSQRNIDEPNRSMRISQNMQKVIIFFLLHSNLNVNSVADQGGRRPGPPAPVKTSQKTDGRHRELQVS